MQERSTPVAKIEIFARSKATEAYRLKDDGPDRFPGGPIDHAECFKRESSRSDVFCLQPLRAFLHVKFDLLPLREGPEAFDLDRRVMAEHIISATVLRDKSKTLRIIEPFH